MPSMGGPTDLEPGTIVRVDWFWGDDTYKIWGIVSEEIEQHRWGGDLPFHIILDDGYLASEDNDDSVVGDFCWALSVEDSWRVGKRPPKEFWIELAKWRLT
jgi:hypothetical protein